MKIVENKFKLTIWLKFCAENSFGIEMKNDAPYQAMEIPGHVVLL